MMINDISRCNCKYCNTILDIVLTNNKNIFEFDIVNNDIITILLKCSKCYKFFSATKKLTQQQKDILYNNA